MKKGVKIKIRNEKYVTENTFEKHMGNIAKSFVRVDASLQRHEEVMQNILKELKQMHEEHKDFRSTISNLYSENVPRDKKIDNLNVRVEKLEIKSK